MDAASGAAAAKTAATEEETAAAAEKKKKNRQTEKADKDSLKKGGEGKKLLPMRGENGE